MSANNWNQWVDGYTVEDGLNKNGIIFTPSHVNFGTFGDRYELVRGVDFSPLDVEKIIEILQEWLSERK